MRKSGAIHINGLIASRKLQICCDFRVWRSVGPLLDDTDPDCRREALECVLSAFKCANAGAVSLTSEDKNTNTRIVTKEMKRSARNIGLGFSSRAIVSGVNRCLTRKNGPNDIKHLAVECFKSMAVSGEEFTRSWNDCNVLVSLCKNIEMRGSKRTNNRPVLEFFSAVEGMGLHGIQKVISQDGYMVSTLKRFNIVVESPATLFDVIDEMEDLRSGSPTVSELVAFLPRAWAVLQPICSGLEVLDLKNRDSIAVLMNEILVQWMQTQWTSCLRDGHENVLSRGRARVCEIILRIVQRLCRAGVVGLELIGLLGDETAVSNWVDFLTKSMGADVPYLSFVAHPLMLPQSCIAHALADLVGATKMDIEQTESAAISAVEKIRNAVSKSGVLIELSKSLGVNTKLMQNAARDGCTEVHFLDTYPLAVDGRKELLRSMVSNGNFESELASSGVVEFVVASMLRDCTTFLAVERYKIPLPFQPYNNTWAIRGEGLALLKVSTATLYYTPTLLQHHKLTDVAVNFMHHHSVWLMGSAELMGLQPTLMQQILEIARSKMNLSDKSYVTGLLKLSVIACGKLNRLSCKRLWSTFLN